MNNSEDQETDKDQGQNLHQRKAERLLTEECHLLLNKAVQRNLWKEQAAYVQNLFTDPTKPKENLSKHF